MKAQGLVMLLAFGVRSVAQVTFDATLTQALTTSDALRGSAVLKLQDLKLSYELNLTGRSLYTFDLDAALAQGVIRFHLTGPQLYDYTVEFTDSLTTTSWSPLARYRAKLEPIDVVVANLFTNAQARFFRVRQDSCSCR